MKLMDVALLSHHAGRQNACGPEQKRGESGWPWRGGLLAQYEFAGCYKQAGGRRAGPDEEFCHLAEARQAVDRFFGGVNSR
jgi:hypothetical protein